jgi:hypothetical protein
MKRPSGATRRSLQSCDPPKVSCARPRPDCCSEYSWDTPVRALAKTTRGAGGGGFDPARMLAATTAVHMQRSVGPLGNEIVTDS